MFRRARLSVKPNVRPGGGARGSAAPNPQRGPEAPRPPEPATEPAPKPAEPTDVPAVDSGGAEPQEKAPGSSDAKAGDENNVEESSKSSSAVPQRRKPSSSTSSLAKPTVSVPSQCHPLSTVSHDAPQPDPTPAKEKQPCSDRYRIYKARKLREMLKEELRKEKKQWKNKFATNESQRPPDRSKMTMRDFIYYLPDSNPMTSSVEQEKKNEKSVASTPTRDRQENPSTHDADDNEEGEEETDDGPLLVPRVKVAEDGSIILDEESLTVEVLRTKGPCVVEENDPIFERGSTTTYSSFRKNYYSKPWSNKETDMFFLAISMVGTDFSMIGQLFPHRARIEIKNKFKREEKTNGWRIDKAFQEKRPFDFDFFAHLLQKVLAEEEKRKQKSTKCQSSKEKASKPRKNVKAKKVTSEEVNDDPEESVNSNVSDPERSLKDAQTVAEEESPTSSGQELEQATLEQDQNQEKRRRRRRRRNQDEADKQEATNALGNVHVESSPPVAEIPKNTRPSEENEGECNREQIPSFPQNTDDDVAGLASSEKTEMRTDSVPSTCNQQDIMPLASESSESRGADLPVSEVGSAASCEVNNDGSTCIEERNTDLENKPPEPEQTEAVKPKARSRFQRPKPNLSRAVGKKTVASQDKQDERNKNSPSETSSEKNHVEKERMNISENFGTENIEREKNLGAETVSDLSEKSYIPEDGQPKVSRPARLMRGRMQRPRPNIQKAAERKEIPTPQEEIGAHVEKNEDESGVDREKNESCVVCEEVISQPEEKGPLENVQSDEPKFLDDCPSIQEGNKANQVKQTPVLRTRFQRPKPKPNTGRKRLASREGAPEETPVSGEIMATLEDTVKPDTSPREKIPNVTIAGLTDTPSTKELESDLEDTGRNDISSNMKMSEMTDATMEMEIGLETIGRDTSPGEMGAEIIDIPMETETGVNEISPMEKVPELIDTTEEIYTNLEETARREIFPQENGLKEVSPISETETGLQETGKELPTGDWTPDMIDSTEEREAHSEETEGREISAPDMIDSTEEREAHSEETEGQEISAPVKESEEANTMGEMETHLKEIGGETSQRGNMVVAPAEQLVSEVDMFSRTHREEVRVERSAREGEELDLQGTGERVTSVMAVESGETAASEEETSKDLKQTGEISDSWEAGCGEIIVGEEMVAVLEKTEVDVSPRDCEPEEHISRQPAADVNQSSSDDSSPEPSLDRKNISNKTSVMSTFVEEKENADKEVSSHLSHVESSSPNSGQHETDPGIRLPDVLEQFSDTNLSKSLPQEQKPLEVKPAPFLRSRFKRPKPNLSRAALKRATAEAEHGVPGKKSETDKMVTIMLQQDSEQADSPSSQHVPSLMASRENDNSGPEEEAVILPCIQTEKDSSPPNSCEPKEDSLTQNQENGLVVPIGTQKMNVVTQETKQSVQITLPVRGRLQRPRPNVLKARQRQVVDRGDAEGVAKNEGSELPKDDVKASLAMVNSHIESEGKAVSFGVSELRVNESHSHVVPAENLSINKTSILDEQIRPENKPHVPSPAQLIRRRFQRVKPNLGGAHHKKEQPSVEKDTTEQSTAPEPEDHVLPKGDLAIQLSLKEKTEILTPLEVSEGKDCVVPEESGSDRNDAQLRAAPAGGARAETLEDHPALSLGLEEHGLSKQISHPQLLKESNYSKTALHRRTTPSSASECEIDHSGKRAHRKMKPNVTKGRGSKRIRGKTAKKEPRASKSVLVTLRASQKEDEDDAEDFDSDYEEETCHLAPEELNKAPVFVPVGLRSPEPVSAQIEETMEELEITMDVADMGCVTVVEHQLSNMDATTQDVQPEDLHSSSFEMVISEQTQEEPGPSDGSTEAAITLLAMGDIVLQSEIITEQGDGVCVFPDVHSKDKSHVPFSPDNVNHKIVHEYQEVSSPVISILPASLEDNKIVSKEQSAGEEAGTMEEVMENTVSTRNTASTMTKHLRMESHFILPEPNSEKILEICGLDGHQEVASVCVTKGTEMGVQRETEENDSEAIQLEDQSLEPAETGEQHQLPCVHDVEGAIASQEAILSARSEDQETNLREVQMLGAAVASSEIGTHTLDLGQGLGESPAEEPLRENSKGNSMLMLQAPEIAPSNTPEVQQENMISPQDVTVNLFTNLQQDGEDEQAFILTLVEIPTNATEGFTDASMQLMPSSLLPAPILVTSGNTVERGDLSGNLQATSVVEDAICLSSGSSDSEKLPAKLDPISRKRVHCGPDENILVPPAKKSAVTPGIDCQECASEVCSKELNVFEKAEESCVGQGIFPASESTPTTPKPQKEHNEPTFQNAGVRSPNEIKDACVEKTMTQLPQDEMVSDKEEKTGPVSSSEQRDSMTSSSKPPLTRPGRRPLGFLSLICPKNSLDSDEVTQTHSKKRLKPHIPVSRRNLKKSNLVNANQKENESSDPLPSPSSTDTTGSSATQASSDQPPLKEKCKNGPKQASEEEATTVSEFVFSDIFIEVDETE
ncbi:transcription factor TFIIIB component B'' homolog isoform X3 [Mesocricetus auratus]|uniref:Transcription factor TFIIIB component B'' homolog isoform X3 n=1 Tax=Mesocricetus auratus TaxID=10036 RepID=A0ABM2W2M1_MESAU|nr:transcription factor TFIIIB component B'' homolog isoform X3 [Mesocricetus auratus]